MMSMTATARATRATTKITSPPHCSMRAIVRGRCRPCRGFFPAYLRGPPIGGPPPRAFGERQTRHAPRMTRRSLRLARAGLAGAGLAGAVGSATWLWRNQDKVIMRRPFNQWTFTHMNRLLPSETVPRSRSPQPLPGQSGPLDVEYWFQGRRRSIAELHKRTNTTAFVVVHRGQ